MAIDVQPGQWISVKITSIPRREAALKTMRRVFRKDPKVAEERKRLKRSRPVQRHVRGGRLWADRPPLVPVVDISPGATYRVFGSVDVLRDLGSVEKHVEVTSS